MKKILEAFGRITIFGLILYLWLWMLDQELSDFVNLSIIVGGIVLIFPIAWLGRRMLDKKPVANHAVRITALIHYPIVIITGISVVRAIKTHQDWSGWLLPVPTEIGLLLVIVTGSVAMLSVINLAVKGFGAPFAVALSQKLAVDWMYAWTRNPMILSTLAFGLSLGIWFQSVMFVLWVLLLFAPALLAVVKIFEERELEIRFGESYLEYKSRTPLLFPRKPRR
jgi:protein-S-isoprenylcysteine O-methyltransferase Ste14